VDVENVKVEKKMGGAIEDTELIHGMIVDKEVVHPGMPKKVERAKIALVDSALEIEKTEVDAKIEITSPDQLKSFMDEEEKMLKNMVERIARAGANVLFCQKGIDDLAQHYLAKSGILAVRRVKESDMEKLARATGGRVVTNIEEISKDDLGYAGLVEERKIGEDEMVFVQKCKNPRSVSILLRGGTEHVVDEAERSIHDALRVVELMVEDKRQVAGGGAIETELALRLREYASTVGGREQLAIEAFSDAMETIPRTLAENAGLDPIDMIVELRSQHEKGKKGAGLDMEQGKIVDMLRQGVVEPMKVKLQAVSSAAEAAVMILRIDDVIASKPMEKEKKAPPGAPGMPPCGPGMPPMEY
jgi:chaperonin GroEL (HSP60 family)